MKQKKTPNAKVSVSRACSDPLAFSVWRSPLLPAAHTLSIPAPCPTSPTSATRQFDSRIAGRNTRRLNVTLPAPLDEFVRDRVAAGDFASPEEVVSAGLRLLQQHEEDWKAGVRRKIDEGWDQAKAGQLHTPAEVRGYLDERKAAWKRERGLE